MKKQTLIGLILVIIGFNILLNAVNLSLGSFLAPLIFLMIGFFLYKRRHHFISAIFFFISASIIFDQIFGMNFMGLLIAFVALYFGIKLVRSPKERKRAKKKRKDRVEEIYEEVETEIMEKEETIHESSSEKQDTSFSGDRVVYTPSIRKSLIGEVHYLGEAFELHDLTIWNGIGEVRIDLSKAIIPEGETVIIVQTLIGTIDIYVPDDLAIVVQAASTIGEVSIFHESHGGINQQISIATQKYKRAPRRVKLILTTFIGEVKVRAV